MAHPEQKRSISPLLWVAGIAILFAVVYSIRALTRETVRVHVAPVTFQTLASNVSTNGKVDPIEGFQAHAPAPAVVRKIYVNEGDHVSAGQLLVRLDDADARARLATAQATLSQAELQLSDLEHGGSTEERGQFSATTNSARLEQQAAAANVSATLALQQKGSASASEVAAAQQRLRAADVALANANSHSTSRYSTGDRANAQAHVADARAAVQAAQAAIAAADIHSPLAGIVYSIPVSEFDFVHDGDDLMDVADLNHIEVRAYFDEPEIGGLKDGQPVTITWEAKPRMTWHGHIEHTPTTIITYGTTRNVGECIITVDDAHEDLPPNSNVTVKVTEMQRSQVLSIPREALHTDGSRNFVYRIVDGKLQQTPVELGPLVTLTNVEITGGVGANDIVVLGPATPGKELSNGLSVKPVE
jgi:HlyD family secretion protein